MYIRTYDNFYRAEGSAFPLRIDCHRFFANSRSRTIGEGNLRKRSVNRKIHHPRFDPPRYCQQGWQSTADP